MAEAALRGADVVVAGLERLLEEFPKAVAAALFQEAEAIMADSKANYVPVDTGTLKNSGVVAPPVIEGGEVSVMLGYGGAAEDYALVQHERLDFHHPNGGGPKYLERPFLDAAGSMEERLGQRLAPLLHG